MIREARMQRGWTQADLAEQIGCSTPAVAGWESGRRLRVDPVYALAMSRVMPELNYMDLVRKSQRQSERPGKRKLDHVRESLVPLPRGLLTAVRGIFTRDQSGKTVDTVMERFFASADEWVDAEGCAHLIEYFRAAIDREERRDAPRQEVLEFLREELESELLAPSEDAVIVDLLRQQKYGIVRDRLREQVRTIYKEQLPKCRWILAHTLLAGDDCDCAFAHLRRASGDFSPRVRELLETVRGTTNQTDAPASVPNEELADQK
jgi:transcriptional regulator with XRE-family HTH domain